MRFSRIAYLLPLAAQLIIAAPAFADCAVPKSPGAVLDGSSATAEEMAAAKAQLEGYRKNVTEYLACTEREAATRIAAAGSNAELIIHIKLLKEKRTALIQAELVARADEFNDQMRNWKLVNRQ